MKYKIKYVSKKYPKGYIGMNQQAADEHFKLKNYPRNTIGIYKKLPKKIKKQTLNHEKIELWLMRYKKMSYKRAHKIALKFEDNPKLFWSHVKEI